MVISRLSFIEAGCKLRVFKCVILKCNLIVIPLLFGFVDGFAPYDFLCPVVGLFYDFKFYGRLRSTDAVQLNLTQKETDSIICSVVQPFDCGSMLFTCMLHQPYDNFRTFA